MAGAGAGQAAGQGAAVPGGPNWVLKRWATDVSPMEMGDPKDASFSVTAVNKVRIEEFRHKPAGPPPKRRFVDTIAKAKP